jgi:hypothetical protein
MFSRGTENLDSPLRLGRDNRMWVVTGPFDGEISNEVGFQSNAFSTLTAYRSNPRYVPESKLLKSGKSYVIGRKTTCDLVVNHKKVSHDHGKFIVEGFSPDDVVRIAISPIS